MISNNLRFDLLTLQLFVAVVEEQSIAQAAEKKHIAVSAVSRRISDLEAMLQVDLLHRHQKGIAPTPAGFALLEHARIILGNVAQLEADLLGYKQGLRGHIRLFVNTSATLESLVDELNRMFAKPVVSAQTGGGGGGGTIVTETGNDIVRLYREMERRAYGASTTESRALARLLAPLPAK